MIDLGGPIWNIVGIVISIICIFCLVMIIKEKYYDNK